MELRHLRYFVAVAEEHHFGRAAARLRIAAPSLSQQIRALERDLRVTLLDRDSHGVALTPAGAALLAHARGLLARADRAREDVRKANGCLRTLTVRTAAGAEHLLGDPAWDAVRRSLSVDVAPTLAADAVHAVREERADAAVVWLAVDSAPDLAWTTLRDVPVHVVLPAGHRLAGGPVVPVAELAAETVVLVPRHVTPAVWDRITDHLGPDVARIVAPPDPLGGLEAVLATVAAGGGVSVVTPRAAARAAVDSVVLRPLDPPLTVSLDLAWHEPADAALRQLVSLFRA